jgi:hypothetical protein
MSRIEPVAVEQRKAARVSKPISQGGNPASDLTAT